MLRLELLLQDQPRVGCAVEIRNTHKVYHVEALDFMESILLA